MYNEQQNQINFKGYSRDNRVGGRPDGPSRYHDPRHCRLQVLDGSGRIWHYAN